MVNKKWLIATPKIKKEIYQMHDGIPIWKHLSNNGTEYGLHIYGEDYGSFAERIGKREISRRIKYNKFLESIFPDIEILSFARKTKFKLLHKSKEYGDYCLEISYRTDRHMTFGKKVFILEIKHGKVQISQQQIRRYSEFIKNPSAYFRKADEVKVIFMIFTEINTSNATATYFLSEFNKELVDKIINAMPVTKENESDNLFELWV